MHFTHVTHLVSGRRETYKQVFESKYVLFTHFPLFVDLEDSLQENETENTSFYQFECKSSGDGGKSHLGFTYARLDVDNAHSHLQIARPSFWILLDR